MPTRKPSSNLGKDQYAKDLKPSTNAQTQQANSSTSSEPALEQSENLIEHQAQLVNGHDLIALPSSQGQLQNGQSSVKSDNPQQDDDLLPADNENPTKDDKQLRTNTIRELDWLIHFQRHSQLLMAVVEPGTFTLRYANDYFCSMMGIAGTYADLADREIRLPDLLPEMKGTAVDSLYRQHVLHLVLRDIYKITVPRLRLLDQPVIISLRSPLYPEPRFIEFAFRSDQLTIARMDSHVDELADLDLEQLLEENRSARLIDSAQLQAWRHRLRLDNYQLSGQLLLEGSDVTERETIRHIIGLLIDRDSILRPDKFRRINKHLRSLFRASNSLILSVENEQTRLFMGTERKELRTSLHLIASLSGSHFLRAAEANRVWNVPDLSLDCHTDCERSLLHQGVRSLLLIPLVVRAMRSKGTRQLAGIVGLMSDRPHSFDGLDCKYAEELMPAFTAALRQAIQQRLTNIHPSVEWRFLQEAERRSWGLPPEPIVFANVYPLYGISDIRGSSEERNRSIQDDLLEQFHLGLRVVEAVCQFQESSLGKQIQLDLLEYIEQIKERVTVDAEVTALRILSDRLEVYLDYFAQCGTEALAAVEAYRRSCSNDHKSVYVSRARYDQTISKINSLLKQTWERWQVRMQQIIPHYCDVESTDGINHMIYVGESIDSKFSAYHLRSLRYEQLRAVCDCARTAFNFQALYDTQLEVTHLVLVQDLTVDILHDENTEKLFEVRGTRDIRYEIVKKRIDKAVDEQARTRITQPGMLTLVYSTEEEWTEYQQYLRYLAREGWVDTEIQLGTVEPLQGITGLRFARVRVVPALEQPTDAEDLQEISHPLLEIETEQESIDE
ncbi:MAG: GAF domain-containing protein [Microcoleus sp. SIO2G3]|nr:GAF domain-containing protein [Microcoleus sp. SIO2G3]